MISQLRMGIYVKEDRLYMIRSLLALSHYTILSTFIYVLNFV